MADFTHLHVHTQYSLLDGLSDIPSLIKKAYDDGQRAMAMTDHGNMYGIYTFVKEVEKFNKEHKDDPFKAIIGCEVYVARNGSRLQKRSDVRSDQSGHHLILLAKNMVGYKNLSHLVSLGWTEGFYRTPRVDKEIMRKYSEGVIACSACLGGELPQVIMADNPSLHDGTLPITFNLDRARKVVEEFIDIYGDDYYIELQRNGHKEQTLVNAALLQLAEEFHLRCIATNDVHFVNREDFPAHKMLICINTRKDYIDTEAIAQDEDQDNGMAYSGEEYFRTTEEMAELFADHPEVLSNTMHVANKVQVISLKHEPTLPKFEVPPQFKDEFDYLCYLTWEGAKRRWGEELSDEIKERLQFELDTVGGMGFPGYFLIVMDFIEAGRRNGIRFGPGRGSAAGSAIAYCLNITNIDPIKYDLLFERFLNPDRISLPDIDIDMDSTGRAKTIEYVSQKYGSEKVAVIVTLMEMKGKTAIRDCARALKLPLAESDRLAKLVPDDAKTLKAAIDASPELTYELENGSPLVKKTLEFAEKLDGTLRGTGVHACGVIIGRDSLFDCIPLATSKNSDTMVVEYEGALVEEAGLLKMDFLGLNTLDIISYSLRNIKKSKGIDIEIDDIPLDDEKTYKVFQNGDTTAIFQFESPGMRKYLRELQPTRFEDIIAMVALYRPGPMDNIPSFINRKQGREAITYPIPEMGKILDETYGITIYQEQVMLLSRLLAGFTRGQADTLRKAMGKKKIDVMESLYTEFTYGGTQRDYSLDDLKNIWEEWKKFASYAFNKSHATCYAFVAYQTAWLKANYTAEFLAANMTAEITDLKKVTELIDEASKQGIAVLPPDINESDLAFSVNQDGAIRFGLAALKGVGANAVQDIIDEREAHGKFKNIFDFIERANLRSCNRRIVESMAAVGTFDSFGNIHRAQFFCEDKDHKTFVERLMNYGAQQQDSSQQMQMSIFDEVVGGGMDEAALPPIPECDEWSAFERLKKEREIAGFYISGHPFDHFRPIIDSFCNTDLSVISQKEDWYLMQGRTLIFAAAVTAAQHKIGKNGNPYGIITIEDSTSSFDWMLFGEDYSKYRHLFDVGQFLLFAANIVERGFEREIAKKTFNLKPSRIIYLRDAFTKIPSAVRLKMEVGDLSQNTANIIQEWLRAAEEKSQREGKGGGTKKLIFSILDKNCEFYTDLFNYEMKVDPETFIEMKPASIHCEISLEK